MTDNEIIKAFRCCYLNEDECEECPCFKDGHCTDYGDVFTIVKQILDLINRLQAENERLKEHNDTLMGRIDSLIYDCDCIKLFTINKFAERLKEKAYLNDRRIYVVLRDDIDDVKKEMVGEE